MDNPESPISLPHRGASDEGDMGNGSGVGISSKYTGCSVQQEEGQARISCSDGTEAVIHDGVPGLPGAAGNDGVGSVGPQGPTGSAGENGAAGTPGLSCTVVPIDGGADIQCGDGSSVVILNGLPGPAGSTSPYTVVELIDPCGDGPGFDEVLLRMADNRLMAHYSHGSLQFLVVLSPGAYETTDGTKCRFTVNSSNEVSWQ